MTTGEKKGQHVTEIIPSDMPDWAISALHSGSFFGGCLEKVECLTAEVERLKAKQINQPYLQRVCERAVYLFENGEAMYDAAGKAADEAIAALQEQQ